MASGVGYRYGVDKPPGLHTSRSFKSELPPSNVRRSNSSSLGGAAAKSVSGRVRVAVRLRPRNAEESVVDADFADCVELQPELKRLKLRKNNWDSDTYEFDEVFTEFASQKRVYESVAKPVVESVLEGYNGTVMAYGRTGTGKTYTLGRLGDEDTSARGIMVRSMEDILSNISPESDSISVSYSQLYMEIIQDLLNPANDNISIVEDQKTGEIALPGATVINIRDQQSFVELLRLGEAHRFAANTKLNTESSHSHALLMVHVKRSVVDMDVDYPREAQNRSHLVCNLRPPLLREGKLIVVDLAGSRRIHKSGNEGHTLKETKSINLSLSALGKCINALAENSAHVPVRDSKLSRLLKDSFGGTSKTSLVVTIGPSPRHRSETASTILFGQRAMKVENMLKIKEKFDYKSFSKKLEFEIDKLICENERQQKFYENEILEAQKRVAQAERKYVEVLETRTYSDRDSSCNPLLGVDCSTPLNHQQSRDATNAEKASITTLYEQVGLQKILSLLESDDASVRTHAVKVVANLATEEANQEKIVEAGGLRSLLMLLSINEDETIRRIAAGAIANLATNEANQELIMAQGGIVLLATTADDAEDPQTLRMVAGAIANLCGNDKLQTRLWSEGGIKALLGMVSCRHPDVLSQVARGIANSANCQSRASTQDDVTDLSDCFQFCVSPPCSRYRGQNSFIYCIDLGIIVFDSHFGPIHL